MVVTATPNGNTHGSICEINGQWYVFYHRQADTTEYSRQAMVAPVDVEVVEGATGYVRISEAEFTSEGFQTGGLDPFELCPAGIACYMVGPEPAYQTYPRVVYSGSHTEVVRGTHYDAPDPYDLAINVCPMVNNTAGSVVGYKYFDFSKTYGKKDIRLCFDMAFKGIPCEVQVYLDRPTEAEGGALLGTIRYLPGSKRRPVSLKLDRLQHYNGKHALFFVFSSDTRGMDLCRFNSFYFSAK